jgi:hypothetical protein
MLTATYMTDVCALRPEFKDELFRGDLSAPDIMATGSHVVQKYYFIDGEYGTPGYFVRPGAFEYKYG